MNTLLRNLKYSLRQMSNQRAVSVALIFTLSVSIFINTVVFSAVNSVLLNVPFVSKWSAPSRVLMIFETNSHFSSSMSNQLPARLRNYKAWKDRSRVFSDIAAWRSIDATVSVSSHVGEWRQLEVGMGTANLFALTGVKPFIGRGFTDSDEAQVPKDLVAIIGYDLYQSSFNGNPALLGSTVTIDGQTATVIGVMPPRFGFPGRMDGNMRNNPQVWLPLNLHPKPLEEFTFDLFVYGRLRKQFTIADARPDMLEIQGDLTRASMQGGGFGIGVGTLKDANSSVTLRRSLVLLQIAVGLVLAIACANAGILLLGRAIGRGKEMAIRTALGASTEQLVYQTLTESLFIAFLAAVIGILAAAAGLRLVPLAVPPQLYLLNEIQIDRYVITFALALAVLSAVCFGSIPATHTLQIDISKALNNSGRLTGSSSMLVRNTLVVAEIALSFLLVVGTGLLIRSFASLLATDVGFAVDHLVVMRISLPPLRYPSQKEIVRFNREIA